MKTLKNILFIVINLTFPFLLVNLLILIDFLINGSGIESEINYQKYKFVWISILILSCLIQLFTLYKSNQKLKNILIPIIISVYCFFYYKYF